MMTKNPDLSGVEMASKNLQFYPTELAQVFIYFPFSHIFIKIFLKFAKKENPNI